MAIKRQKTRYVNTRGQMSFEKTSGIASFAGTNASVTIPVPFSGKKVEAWSLAILGAPANTSGTNVVDVPAIEFAAISATQVFEVIAPVAGTAAFNFTVSTTVAASDSTYWSVGVVNKTGPVTMVDSTVAANTSKATGGTALTGYAVFSLTVAAAAVAAGDVLEVTFTKTSTPGNLVELAFNTVITQTNTTEKITETLYLDEAANESNGMISVQAGVVTVSRIGPAALTSGLRFAFNFEGY